MALRRRPHEEGALKPLEVNASMTGSLSFQDPVNLQINGQFEGTLDSKGTLVIGEKAIVKATIRGESISIAGQIEGSVTASRRLELLPSARVIGKISSPRLVVHEGALLHGPCEMVTQRAEPQWITLDELARYLEIDAPTLLEWAESGRLPAHREGSIWRFDRKQVEDWLAQEKIR